MCMIAAISGLMHRGMFEWFFKSSLSNRVRGSRGALNVRKQCRGVENLSKVCSRPGCLHICTYFLLTRNVVVGWAGITCEAVFMKLSAESRHESASDMHLVKWQSSIFPLDSLFLDGLHPCPTWTSSLIIPFSSASISIVSLVLILTDLLGHYACRS